MYSSGIQLAKGSPYHKFISILLILAIFSSNLGSNTVSASPSNPSGLVGYWTFDEGTGNLAYDVSGNNNNGLLNNGPTWTTGRYGGALNFDGVDDFVQIATSPTLNLTSGMTIACWARVSGETGQYEVLVSHGFSYSGSNYLLEFLPDGLTPSFTAFNADLQRRDATSGMQVPMDNWTFLVGVFDTNSVKLYVNTLLVAERSFSPAAPLNVAGKTITIGCHLLQAERNWFNGTIDEVMLYDRALNPSEIMQLFLTRPNVIVFDKSYCSASQSYVGNAQTVGFHAIWSKNGSDISNCQITVNQTRDGIVENASTFVSNGSGWIMFNVVSDSVKTNAWKIAGVDGWGLTYYNQVANSPQISWIHTYPVIDASSVSDSRADVGSVQTVGFHSKWIGNGSDVKGATLTVKETIGTPGASLNTAGLVGYWQFNEGSGTTTLDTIGSHTGTFVNDPTWAAGITGSALSFDGSNDAVSIPDSPDLRLQNLSICVWVYMTQRPADHSSANHVAMVNKLRYLYGPTYGYKLDFESPTPTNDDLVLAIGDGSAQRFLVRYNSVNDLALNNWHLIVGTYDGQTASIYIDGTLKASSPSSYVISNDNAPLGFGQELTGGSGHYAGSMDNIMIFNRTLTANEISHMYNNINAPELEVTTTYITYKTDNQGWIRFNATSDSIAKKTWSIGGVSTSSGTLFQQTASNPYTIWDQVNVTLSIDDDRLSVGQPLQITKRVVYGYDNSPFIGTIMLNDTKVSQNIVGKYTYLTAEVNDPLYGLRVFSTNSVSCIFDHLVASSEVKNIILGYFEIFTTVRYEFDNTLVTDAKVTINGMIATNTGGGIYKLSRSGVYSPFESVAVNVSRTDYSSISYGISIFNFYNVLLIVIVVTTLAILAVGIYRFREMSKKKISLESMAKQQNRIRIDDASKQLRIKPLTVKKMLEELLNEQRINGALIKNGRLFVSESLLINPINSFGRFNFKELGNRLGEDISDDEIKSIITKLHKELKVKGYFTTDGLGFVTEERLKEELRRFLL